ncbi:hypothetical protein ABW21_db0204505 [Orbilia brochopaga]|nr:hypothetical protein ABW21_db0204505 [Drechslerella brochopaga]
MSPSIKEFQASCHKGCQCHRTALAAVHNPLNEDQILNFYSTGYQNLGVRARNINALESASLSPRCVSLEQGKQGVILHDSPLVAMKLKGQIQVIAVSRFLNEEGEYYVAKVSPGFETQFSAEAGSKPVTIATQYPILAGTGDGNNLGWLYELAKANPGDCNDQSNQIVEHYIGDQCGESNSLDPEASHRQTQLAAFYDATPGNADRYVVYQNPSLEICYKAMQDTTSTPVTCARSKRTAYPGTPLAACTLEGQYFIFYIGNGENVVEGKMNFIWVLNAAVGETDQNPERVGGEKRPFQIAMGAYLSVMPLANKSTGLFDIHIFCFKQADGNSRSIAHTIFPTKVKVPSQ